MRIQYIILGVLLIAASCKKSDSGPKNYTTNKSALESAIDSLTTVYNNAIEGSKPGDYAVGAKEALDTAILLAKGGRRVDGLYAAGSDQCL